jgi:hypothetical protein
MVVTIKYVDVAATGNDGVVRPPRDLRVPTKAEQRRPPPLSEAPLAKVSMNRHSLMQFAQ